MKAVAFAALSFVFWLPAAAQGLEWPGALTSVEEALANGNPTEKTEALEELRGSQSPRAAELVSAAMYDSSRDVRALAADVAGTMNDSSLVPHLVALLTDRRSDVRVAAVTSLGSLRSYESAGAISRLLADPNAEVREAAVRALALTGSNDGVLSIVGVLQDRSRDVVVAALESLGDLGQPGTVYAVLDKVHDPVEEVSIGAIAALGRMRAAEAVPALLETVETGRPNAAVAAIEALGEIGLRQATPALVAQVVAPRVDGAREAALESLAMIGDPEAFFGLRSVLLEIPADVGELAELTAPLSWQPLRELAPELTGSRSEWSSFLMVWLPSGDPDALASLQEYHATSPDVLTSADRLQLLMLSPSADAFCLAVPEILTLDEIGDPTPYIEFAARSEAGACISILLDGWPPEDAGIALTWFVELAEMGNPAALDILEEHLSADTLDWETMQPAIPALATMGDEAAPLVVRLLESQDERLRREAAAMLAETSGDWIDTSIFNRLRTNASARPENLIALRAAVGTPHESEVASFARSLISSSGAASVAGFDLIAGDCTAMDEARVANLVENGDFWVARASATFAARCDMSTAAGAMDARSDAFLRALAMRWVSADEAGAVVVDSTRSDDERVAALARLRALGDDSRFSLAEELVRDPSTSVAAASWLVLADRSEEMDPVELELHALAAPSAVERAAIYLLLRESGSERLSHVRRREESVLAARLIDSQELEFDMPLQVVTSDGRSGAPRLDESIFVIHQDGGFELLRTDLNGRVPVPDGAPIAALAVERLR